MPKKYFITLLTTQLTACFISAVCVFSYTYKMLNTFCSNQAPVFAAMQILSCACFHDIAFALNVEAVYAHLLEPRKGT